MKLYLLAVVLNFNLSQHIDKLQYIRFFYVSINIITTQTCASVLVIGGLGSTVTIGGTGTPRLEPKHCCIAVF